MNHGLLVTVGLAVLAFAITSANDAQAQCKSRLLDRSFSCSFRSDSEFHPVGRTCFEFRDTNSDILDPPKFRMTDIGEASIEGIVLYNCTCDPVGSSARPTT